MFALPVSGLDVTLRRPAGEEDVLLSEAPRCDMRLSVRLLSRLAEWPEDFRCDALPVADVERLLLELRRLMFGDTIRSTTTCPTEGCGAKVDVTFQIGEYLAHHPARPAADVRTSDEEGWLELLNAPVRFRLPLASDQIAVTGRQDAERLLAARCIRPAQLPARLLGRVARAMERLAPPLADVVQGACPQCGEQIEVYFDPQDFVLRELRAEASLVFDDIHRLASRYQWSEAAIMALPRSRRMRYAELIGQDRGTA